MMRQKRFAAALAALILIAVVSQGCGKVGNTTPRTIKSDDGLSQIVIPPGWKVRSDLNEEADIQVGDLRNNGYLIVLSESKIDFEGIEYQEHSRLTREGFMETMEKGKITSGPSEIEINHRRAVKYEMQGSVNGVKIVYFHITVDGEKAFHQILAWTVPSQVEKNRGNIDFVVNSFQEL